MVTKAKRFIAAVVLGSQLATSPTLVDAAERAVPQSRLIVTRKLSDMKAVVKPQAPAVVQPQAPAVVQPQAPAIAKPQAGAIVSPRVHVVQLPKTQPTLATAQPPFAKQPEAAPPQSRLKVAKPPAIADEPVNSEEPTIVEEPIIADEPVATDEPAVADEPTIADEAAPVESTPAPTPKEAAPTGKVYRFDSSREILEVPADELKVGLLYLHDSPKLGRQVWSFYLGNGRFWHALGEGTTQAAPLFDFRISQQALLDELQKIDQQFATEVSDVGRVYLRLDAKNEWRLIRGNSVPSIYDLETNQRWEMQWGKYLPVVHLNGGNDWIVNDGKYKYTDWSE